jgi:uncharacterized membrane protein
MTALSFVRVVHIAIGVLAFVVLPVPLLTKKGGRLHVSFGRVYVYAMGALAATGIPIAARGLLSENPARRANALFLFFIALLASDNAWIGIRALRANRTGCPGPSVLDRALPAMLLAGSIGLGALGLARGVVLHLFFGVLGALLALTQLSYWTRSSRTRADAIARHIGGMGVSSITAVTAFLVTNARHVFHLGAFNVFVWITPAVLGGIAIGVAQRAWADRKQET